MTERRLAAILSADVVGYSRLMAEDEEATVRAAAIASLFNEMSAPARVAEIDAVLTGS